jgi:4-hydroxy-2-oxoheptanedioate aldolase
MMQIGKNFLKDKVLAGKPVIGTFNTLGSPMASEVLARSGFDFLIIDFEHGPFDIKNVSQYVNACEINQCSPIIRIPTNSSWMTLQALDQGAHGIMVPGINDYKSAKNFVANTKYSPLGNRGYTPFTKSGGFTNRNNDSYLSKANDFTFSSIIIESLEGLSNLDDILKIENLDLIYFGAYDLSQALGFTGNNKHPKVISTIEIAVQKVINSGKLAGGFVAQSQDDISWLLDIGIKFIIYNVDSDIILNNTKTINNWFKKNNL